MGRWYPDLKYRGAETLNKVNRIRNKGPWFKELKKKFLYSLELLQKIKIYVFNHMDYLKLVQKCNISNNDKNNFALAQRERCTSLCVCLSLISA